MNLLNHINTYQSEADYQNDNSKNFPNVSYIVEDDIVLFEGEIGYEERYFTIKSLEDDNDIMFKLSSESGTPSASSAKTISVSTDDGETWTDYTSTTNGTTIATLNMGEKVLIKGNNDTYYGSGWLASYSYFAASKQIDVYGNIMSLIYGDDFKEQYSFPSGTTYNFGSFFISAPVVSAENLILPATTLTAYCYNNMFKGCNHLVKAPVLPATELAIDCYSNMFNRCTSLVTAPELPATTLVDSCYSNMFKGCTSLVTAPELPATTLASSCYSNMFQGCTSLTTAPELPAATLANSCYSGMFSGTNVLPDCSNIDFTSNSVVSSGGLIGLFTGTKVTDSDLDRLLPKNTNGKYYLPATTLANSCYSGMFNGCTSLTTAPELPATTLVDSCYNGMFAGCTSLTTAPELPATTLTTYCYYYMFRDCKGLTTAPKLPATTLANSCYSGMFNGCTSLTTAPELPATTLVDSCYSNMFQGCTSLVTAPTLPARYLKNNSYGFMFQACTNLNYIKAMFTTTPNTTYTSNWVNGVASSGTFVKNRAATWSVTGVNGIPSGWTVQKASS